MIARPLSANLWHDWPRYRRTAERLESFARLVEKVRADVLLLQEVALRLGFSTAAWLHQRLGMGYIYSRATPEGSALKKAFFGNRSIHETSIHKDLQFGEQSG